MNTIEIKDVQEEKKPKGTVMKIVIIAVILVVLVFLSIGIVKVVPKALDSLANASLSIGGLFSNDNEPSTGSNSGTKVATSSNGGFSIRDLTNTGTSTSVNYIPSPATTSSSNTSSNSSSNTSSNTSTNSNSNTYVNYNVVGASDIAVSIVSIGKTDKTTGQYIATNSFTSDDMVVVKFKIENRGPYATGQWSARVDMPSNDTADKVRSLGPINSLPPGSAITGEARFDNPMSGTNNLTITVDTLTATQDTNRTNNTVSVPVYSTGTNTGGNGSYNPGATDLRTTILQTGTVNAYGQFVPGSYARYGEKVAVQFEVANIGGTTSGIWSWKADLSGATYNTYTTTENALAPGQSIKIIVGFDTFNQGISNFSITADSTNSLYEQNEGNNSASVSVNIGY